MVKQIRADSRSERTVDGRKFKIPPKTDGRSCGSAGGSAKPRARIGGHAGAGAQPATTTAIAAPHASAGAQ